MNATANFLRFHPFCWPPRSNLDQKFNNRSLIIASFMAILITSAAFAQYGEIEHITTWFGNTFNGGDKWVQNYIETMKVEPNGHCFTYSDWDEGHNERGEYFDGDVKVRNVESPAVSGAQIDINGVSWSVEGSGVRGSNGQSVPDCKQATGVGVYRPKNLLMVADDGAGEHVIKFYDVSGTPSLIKTFGVKGGIGAGTPGVVTPTKFWGLTGCGSDTDGNIYVAISEHGSIIRCFKKTGDLEWDTTTLKWEVMGLHFCDNADVDPTTDAIHIFGRQEHYIMDYTQPVGKQWKFVGYSLDKDKYPNDPRLRNSEGSVMIRYKNGKRFMFTADMNMFSCNMFRFEGEIAVHFANVSMSMQGWWVDDSCGVWRMSGGGVEYKPCTGVDTDGTLTYGSARSIANPGPLNSMQRICYEPARDLLFLGGGTPDHPAEGWGHMGPVVCCYENGSTSPKLRWQAVNPYFHNDAPVADRMVPISWDVAGEYLFIGYVTGDTEKWDHDSPGVIRVYNLKDGTFVGRLHSGPEVFWEASWIDMMHGMTAFQNSRGQYVVIREENWKCKQLMFLFPTDIAPLGPNTGIEPQKPSSPAPHGINRIKMNGAAAQYFDLLGNAVRPRSGACIAHLDYRGTIGCLKTMVLR
jgi:hypothetical protein